MSIFFPKQTPSETYHVLVEEYNARDLHGGTEFADLNICVLTG
jgi:hypothetical protein